MLCSTLGEGISVELGSLLSRDFYFGDLQAASIFLRYVKGGTSYFRNFA